MDFSRALQIRKRTGEGLSWGVIDSICAGRRNRPNPFAKRTYAVELTSVEDASIKDVEVVEANDMWLAAWYALQTRNIPTNWVVTELESE